MTTENASDDDRLLIVCDNCLCACCWHGEFYCQKSRSAGTREMRVSELRALGREHESYWASGYR